jgi:hypothetical protein
MDEEMTREIELVFEAFRERTRSHWSTCNLGVIGVCSRFALTDSLC